MNTLLKSMRIPFLALTLASIFLGFSTSVSEQAQISILDFSLVFAGALLAHISVNTFNEYYDFRSGLDAKTKKTPFSGGSGALIENPEAVDAVFYVAIISLSLTIAIGIYFTFSFGVLIFPLGLIGIFIIITYTTWLNRSPFLCLVAPGIGFGPLMVIGTHVVLTGDYSMQAFWVSLVLFFLASNLLLINQFPDIAADKSIGRRHFPIVYGVARSTFLYGAFTLAACGVIAIGVYTEILPKLCIFGLMPMGITIAVIIGAMKHATSLEKLLPYMGMNVVVTVLTPILLGLSILHS